MRKILAVLLATVSMTVAAETWRAENSAGGEIVLTKSECTAKGLDGTLLGYSYAKDGTVLWFCYTLVGTDIIAVFVESGNVKRYDTAIFYKK